ncbi:uncharacterized protein BX664DRAFT_356267 [Halteromyces radiatus]|uniref:uncharacterized protein n=1 Tax=Halteromyces radiatus TaxID=101107 RepID=UPI002221249E|nr:uncharacterized protein BX664DRAFT_356267 [Halteromyces radiatus]KAI8096973.1 hypothetical protein BX664DRAFT_356267 [Halteromyces radiatus]
MEYIPTPNLDIFTDDPFFSLSEFDLELQQQAQAAIQQPTQELWQDFDRYLPVDCQPFINNQSINTPINNTIQQPLSTKKYEPNISPPYDFDVTPIVPSQYKDIIKQEYPSPEQQTYIPSSPQQQQQQQQQQHSMLVSSIDTSSSSSSPSSPPQQQQQQQQINSTQPTETPISQSTSSMTPTNVADIIAKINWDSPVLSYSDPNKVPIQRLKPSINTQTPTLSTSSNITGGKQKKTAHNAIERRYRNNINDRITELKNAVPALLHAKPKDRHHSTNNNNNKRNRLNDDDDDDIGDDGEEYLDGVAVATKLNKATILRKATEYITHLKRTGDNMKRENDSLQHLLAQLPGGHEVLAHYQVQKIQREQMMQRQLMMERQLIKQEQQNRKKAASKRKRARKQHINDDEFDDGSLSSNSGDHPRTPSSDSSMTNSRVFMALFMAITFFSSSPLTTPAGSEQVNNHHHVSRTASEQMNGASMPTANESFNGYESINNHNINHSWLSIDDGWSLLRLVLFIACMIQLLLPYLKTWIFGRAFRVRRMVSHAKLRRQQRLHPTGKNKKLEFGNKSNSMSPGDEKCMQMYQLLVKLLLTEHDDTTVRISSKNTIGLLWSLMKEMTLFTARHVFGYDIACNNDEEEIDMDDDDEWDQQQLQKWSHVFKWIKLNECECLGGNPFISRLTLLYHSLRMLNLVDSLQEEFDDDDDQEGKQISSMRARAYATATIQVVLALPSTFLSSRIADYLWGLAMWDANEEDTWACLTEEDQQGSFISALSTKSPWVETLDVIHNQISTWTSLTTSTSKKTLGLSLSANAPALVPTAILSNLYLLDRLESDFRSLIDGMMMPISSVSKDPSTTMFFAYASSLSLNDDSRRVADWFSLVGAAVEALWRRDVERAEQSMMTLVQRVPRAMIAPGFSKKKTRQSELDTITKQQVIHMLAGATLLLKQDSQGIKELEIAESLRQKKIKKSLPTTNELEATHVEGRIMALAEFAVMLVGLEAWIFAWQQLLSPKDDIIQVDKVHPTVENTNKQIRSATQSLRRMVCRPALTGLETQNMIIDRLGRIGRFVEEQPIYDDLDNNDNDSAFERSDMEEDAHQDGNERWSEKDKMIRLTGKALAILHGN